MDSTINKFWSRVDKTGDCWLWTGPKNNMGYGLAARISSACTSALAHRISWSLTNGTVPREVCVLHKCDTPLCVNPDHLFTGTLMDNSRDMADKGRGKSPFEKYRRLTNDQVEMIRDLFTGGEKASQGSRRAVRC